MSLDVYLIADSPVAPVDVTPRIYIREDGQTKQILREEWDRRFPGRKPVTMKLESESYEVYHGNITHNLSGMAKVAGIYKGDYPGLDRSAYRIIRSATPARQCLRR